MSELLRSLTKNERIVCYFEQIAHSPIFSQKNERFAQKTDERIPSPALSEQLLSQSSFCLVQEGSESTVEEFVQHPVNAFNLIKEEGAWWGTIF